MAQFMVGFLAGTVVGIAIPISTVVFMLPYYVPRHDFPGPHNDIQS